MDSRVIKVIDLKTPASGEEQRNLWENLKFLLPQDQIKIVICDRADYEWAKQIVDQYQLTERAQILFSPSHQQMPPQDLADWILQDRLAIRFQLQLHKYIWGEVPGK